MPHLLRVRLPDIPGSLGRLASAIGEAGADIEVIEIVERGTDGTALDDVLIEIQPGRMPDSIVSACNAIDGVEVVWISRYPAGGNLLMDLEAAEDLTTGSPDAALDRVVDLMLDTFRVDWAVRLHRAEGIVHRTEAAPDEVDFVEIERATGLETLDEDDNTVYAAARINGNEMVVVGRHGGPEFLDSEIARLGHLVALAATIAQAG